jgi:hypothetical protein
VSASVAEKRRARATLNRAVARGEIAKPFLCARFSEECSPTYAGFGQVLVAHHEDYSQPLSVVWLCHRCHGAVHRRDALADGPSEAAVAVASPTSQHQTVARRGLEQAALAA